MRPVFAAACVALALPAWADGVKTYPFEGSFEDATFALESAIVGRGLHVDHISHVGEMLARTKADVGGQEDLFSEADVYLFCSAVLSRKVMEADPRNIAHCPYSVFVSETASGIEIGYRQMPDGVMQEVEAFLDEIAQEAAGG